MKAVAKAGGGRTGRRRCSHGLSELKRADSQVTYTPVYAIYSTLVKSFQRPLIERLRGNVRRISIAGVGFCQERVILYFLSVTL